MIRSSLFCALIASSLVSACATDNTSSVDELAGETAEDGEAGKADAADAFSYFTVTPDERKCTPEAGCGGYYVQRPNRSTVQCGRAQVKLCYVNKIEWNTGMPASLSADYEKRLRAGETLILRGDVIAPENDGYPALGVTEIWVPQSESGALEGTFVFAKDNGIRCLTAPCPSITESRLNSNRSAQITDVDFVSSGASEDALNKAYSKLFNEGVIIVGDRQDEAGENGARTRVANQFFLKAPVPLF
ncbi:MAG: DUF6748 domain-containing protein [Kofleriaceae bacterium]